MRDISTQLQTGLQAFLQQSMENMFRHLAPTHTNPAPQASTAQPHIVSITPLSAVPAATKSEEPMDATSSQPPPAIKKGLANVKGSSAIVPQSLEAVASHIQVPSSAPTQTTTVPPSAQPMVAPSNLISTTAKLQSPLQVLEQEEYGADSSASSFTTPRSEEPTDTGQQAAPPNLPF